MVRIIIMKLSITKKLLILSIIVHPIVIVAITVPFALLVQDQNPIEGIIFIYGMSIVCGGPVFWAITAIVGIFFWIRSFISPTVNNYIYAFSIWTGLWYWPPILIMSGMIRYCGP